MSKIIDSILGFAIGDAMGVPIEFENRDSLLKDPVVEMKGFGSYDVPSGVWSDDTSLTLATIDSILGCHTIDYEDMMKKFCDFLNFSKYTATDKVFDIGKTTKESLMRYYLKKNNFDDCGNTDVNSNGNGSLMRMVPIAFYTYYADISEDKLLGIVKKASSLTHAHEFSVLGCYIYVKYIHFILSGYDKFTAYEKVKNLNYYKFSEDARRCYKRFLTTDIYKLDLDYIKSSGYIVDTLEAVIWTFLNTNSFMEAIVGSINLGGDTDTIGALTGALAGLIYDVPSSLISKLKNNEYLLDLSKRFDEELRLNILKFDMVIDNRYGIVKGNHNTLFIKVGSGGSIQGYQNKYLKIARSVNYKYGLTVVVASNIETSIINDFENVKEYLCGDIYFMGMSNGASQGIQNLYDDDRIKSMLLVNCPLMINLHKTKEGISKYKGKITFVFGTKDPSFNYLPLIQDFRNVRVVTILGQDHNFSKGDEFLELPDKYLFSNLKEIG